MALAEFIGLLRALVRHPLWNTAFLRQFGCSGVLVFVVVVIVAMLLPVISMSDYQVWVSAAWGVVAFVFGGIPTFLICMTTRLVVMMTQKKIPIPWLWVLLQVVGVVLILAGSLLESGELRFLPLRSTQGVGLVGLGVMTLLLSTAVLWRRYFPEFV